MKSKLRKQQLTVTLSDCNYLAHVLVLLVVQFLLCFILNLRTISKYKPPGVYIRRSDLTEGFLRFEFWGAYLEGLILGILRYI